MYTLDIIIPCYNEEKSIPILYDELINVLYDLHNIDSRFIFIDDGSTDNSLRVIKNIVKNDKRCVYVAFSRNFGKDSAILAGLKFSNADFACIIDADMQHPPKMIPEMLDALIDENYDVAAAKRITRKNRKIKDRLSESFYSVINAVSDIKIEQNAQDFRIMKRKVVNAVLCMHECDRFSRGLFGWVGYKTKWFEHKDEERVAGQSKWNVKALFKYALVAMTSFSTAPLRIPTIFGCVLLASAIINEMLKLCAITLFDINSDLNFIGGLILVSIGIVGEYLSRVLIEAKHRPDFIITETNVLFDEHSRTNYTFDVIDVYEDDIENYNIPTSPLVKKVYDNPPAQKLTSIPEKKLDPDIDTKSDFDPNSNFTKHHSKHKGSDNDGKYNKKNNNKTNTFKKPESKAEQKHENSDEDVIDMDFMDMSDIPDIGQAAFNYED